MYRRNSTNPTRRLDRQKSVTSVKSVHLEHISPETAERDARVAATQAFARARERSATDTNTTLWPPPRPHCQKSLPEKPLLCRHQSIRFVQTRPSHLPPLPPMNSTTQNNLPTHPARTLSRYGANVEVNSRPSTSASASGMVCATKGAAGDYINTLFTNDEYYTPEDGIASMPSSYRKLRKSRSMLTNRPTRASVEHSSFGKPSVSANQLPVPEKSYFRHSRGGENLSLRRLKTPKSMSFLRGFRDNFVPPFRSEDDAAGPFVSLNEDNSPNTARPYLRPKQSRFFRTKVAGEDRVFRKSMRDTSNSTVSISGIPVKNGSLRYKARQVSQTLRHKLKDIFGLSKDDDNELRLPLQHIDAQKSHIFNWGDSHYETDEGLHGGRPNTQASVSCVASGVPSLHAVPSYQQLHSRQGSMESLRSDHKATDDRSRVTSWSNSDADTVITHTSSREDWEKKRLSIINEHGAHVCSSSAQFATISEHSNPSTTSLRRPIQARPGTVDGQRIYSALMKRIGQSQQSRSSVLQEQNGDDDIVQLGTVPHRKSSLRLRRLGRDPASTIRYVFPESEVDAESPKKDCRLDSKEQGSPSKPGTSPTSKSKQRDPTSSASASANTNTENSLQRDACSGGPPPLVRTLSSRSSAFFGSPTRHLFRAESPYRRALQDRMQTTSNEYAIRSPPDFNPWMRSLSNLPNLPIRRSSTHGSDADVKLHYTESIYSTNTEDGQCRRHSVLSVVEDFERPPSTHGDVTIFMNPSTQSKRCASLPPKQRVTSSSSSVEWKMWLSSNVEKLEDTTKQVESNDFKYGLSSTRPLGHVRENAQINDEEEDQMSDPSDTPCRAPGKRGSIMDPDREDVHDSLPTPFDAGDKDYEIVQSQLSLLKSSPRSKPVSTSVTPALPPKAITPSTSTQSSVINHEKELPKVPPLEIKEDRFKGHTNIAPKLMQRQLKAKSSIVPLTNRSHSDVGQGQAQDKKDNSANSRQKLNPVTPTKAENMSPAAQSDDDPYGVEGSGVLGPGPHSVGSRRMVDIFLSSRRRRMASDEEGSVFL
ncbi:hypothetical protein NPX13_g2163 [Xylaria arbuscula]|uniref:Uncharacterized protein n=1 Tax=Xylaria arbuscula TaxID=114810 RepID=A0A9W8NK47_9PEZI|nr:hypothetical protein NPX13_g2163 [Xylaria arbuscula]